MEHLLIGAGIQRPGFRILVEADREPLSSLKIGALAVKVKYADLDKVFFTMNR